MSDKVEQVARAMFESLRGDTHNAGWDHGSGDTNASQEFKDRFRNMARTAIAAMRDVDTGSPAILVAGKKALFSYSEDPTLDDARKCWHAMIDAALKD